MSAVSTLTSPATLGRAPGRPEKGWVNSRALRWTAVIVVWAYSVVPAVVETALIDRQHYKEGKTASNPLVVALDDALSIAVPILAVGLLLLMLLFSKVTGESLLLVVAPGLVLAANELVHGREPTLGLLITSAVGTLLVIARVKPRDLGILGYLGALVAAAAIALSYLDPSKVFISGGSETFEKSLTGTSLLSGIFSNANVFGMFLALALPFAFTARRWWVRWPLIGVIAWALVLSSSRTALAGAAVVLAVIALSRVLPQPAFRVVAVVGLVAACIASVRVPFTETDPEAYTFRGAIWMFNRDELGGHWLFGLGAHWYADNYAMLSNALSSAASHGHNLVLTTLVMGGAVTLAAWAAVIVTAFVSSLRDTDRRQQAVGVAFVLGLIVIGVTETPFGMLGWGPLSSSTVLPLFVLAARHWIERDDRAQLAQVIASTPSEMMSRSALRAMRR